MASLRTVLQKLHAVKRTQGQQLVEQTGKSPDSLTSPVHSART